MIEEIAYALDKDPLEIRKLNFYGQPGSGRTTTPYHQEVEDNVQCQDAELRRVVGRKQ